MGYRILIVDDSATMRSVIRRTVEMSGVEVSKFLEAGSGVEGLQVLTEEAVDLVLADINMPGMSGVEMCEAMLEDEALASVPVVVVSTEASRTRIAELKSKGVQRYVHKPFTPEQIRDVVLGELGVCHARDM